MDYSVLMSVYHKENPAFLRQSMESIFTQTKKTNDFVLMCDGPLTEELDKVISDMQSGHGDILNVIRLEKNAGLGRALNKGMSYCKNELIARMDSDDIARPDRCEKQLRVFAEMPEVGLCSGIIEEFSVSPEKIEARRIPPESHEQILKFLRRRNPFNHPCVMYRKSEVLAAGEYQDFYLLEDYYLWIRMLQNGTKGHNIQEPLLWMRAGSDLYKRRAGWKYAKSQIRLFDYMRNQRLIGPGSFALSCILRVASSMAPNGLRKIVFRKYSEEINRR